jgi:hypothetical protein
MHRIFICWLFALTVSLSALPSTVGAQISDNMKFEAVPPMKPLEIFGNAWSIYASGIIDRDAPTRLKNLIDKNNISDVSLMFFDSRGGDTFASIEIGRIIRSHKFATYIGKKGEEENDSFHGSPIIGGKRYKHAPGVCFSACALSFLGGEFRYFSDSNGLYGVHRFFAAPGGTLDSDFAQLVSASELQYIRDMGIDQRFFNEIVKAGKEEINILSAKQLEMLGVVNNGAGNTLWTIESAGEFGLYLRGERNTIFGEQKIVILCAQSKSKLIAWAYFRPRGKEELLPKMNAISIFIDGKQERIPFDRETMTPFIKNGWAEIIVPINNGSIDRMIKAKTFGVGAQFAYDAPVFWGIRDMDFVEGARKLPGFLKTCH